MRVALAVLGTVVLLAATGALLEPAHATVYPPLPEPGRAVVSNLSVSSVVPGASTPVWFVVSNPTNASLLGTTLTLGVYAFNGFPGDASAALPVAHAPVLANASASAEVLNFSIGTLPSGATVGGSVLLATSSDTPTGTFAIRTALSFSSGGQPYRLESRGWFSASVWQNATELANGSGTVNLTRLNVSGILPETAVLVRPASWPIVLGVLVAVGSALVGLGAYVYFRRTSASRSGVG